MSMDAGGRPEVEILDAPLPAGPQAAPRRTKRPTWVRAGYLIAIVVALIPAARMAGIVYDASELQYSDYWLILPRFMTSTGGLDLGGLFQFQNGHPLVVAQLVFWLNVRLFGGSNITLGLFVVALVLGQLTVISFMLRRSAMRPIERMALLVLASALLFDLTGTWSFVKAMSGTAWLSVNLFALLAVYLRSRDRFWPALAVGVVAAASYGTGIMVWPALIATGLYRRPIREWWREWPNAVAFGATLFWYKLSSRGEGVSDLVGTVRVSAKMLGFVLGLGGDVGSMIGYVGLIGAPLLAIYLLVLARKPGVAAWAGLTAFGWLAVMEISSGRLRLIDLIGVDSRYSSLNAIVWIGFAALLIYVVHDAIERLVASRGDGATARTPAAAPARLAAVGVGIVVIALLIAGSVTAGGAIKDSLLTLNTRQSLSEIALQFDMTDSSVYIIYPYGKGQDIATRMRAVGHFPFVDGWDLDCGLRGRKIDASSSDQPEIGGGVLAALPSPGGLQSVVEIVGNVVTDRSIRCVVVANDRGVVVGAAALHADVTAPLPGTKAPPGVGFRALAKEGGSGYRVYVMLDGAKKPRFLAEVPKSDVADSRPTPE